MADVNFSITQTNAVTFTIAAVLINQVMIVNFSSVTTSLVSAYFAGKTLNDIVLIANGTEMITQGMATKATTAGTEIILTTSMEGTGTVKAIIAYS